MASKIADAIKRRLKNRKSGGSGAKPSTMSLVGEEVVGGGVLALSCVAEGYYGAERFQVAGVDARGPTGLLGMIAGGWMARRGSKYGRHLLSAGRGAAHSVLAGASVRYGQRMATARAAAPAAASSAPAGVQKIAGGDDTLEGFLRDIHLIDPALQAAGRT